MNDFPTKREIEIIVIGFVVVLAFSLPPLAYIYRLHKQVGEGAVQIDRLKANLQTGIDVSQSCTDTLQRCELGLLFNVEQTVNERGLKNLTLAEDGLESFGNTGKLYTTDCTTPTKKDCTTGFYPYTVDKTGHVTLGQPRSVK